MTRIVLLNKGLFLRTGIVRGLDLSSYGVYSHSTTYAADQTVLHDGSKWIAKPDDLDTVIGEEPGTGNSWVLLEASTEGLNDYISVTCPDLSEDIDLSISTFEITSSEDADFLSGVSSVTFGQSTLAPYTLPDDAELRFPLSLFTNTNLSSVTGVRFNIQADDPLDFKVASIRCISEDWTYAPLDFDTVSGVIELPVSPTGDPDYPIDFPTASEGNTELEPDDWPVLWMPVNPKDFTATAQIHTGEMDGTNVFWLFFRGKDVDDSVLIDFEEQTMKDMNGIPPEEGNPLSEAFSYLVATVEWGASPYLSISDQNDTVVHYESAPLEANTDYFITVKVKGPSIRVQINELEYGYTGAKVLDTGEIIDHDLIDVRKGLVGWWAALEDGDAHIANIRPVSANYGELLTGVFESPTPAIGASLIETSTPPEELVSGVGTGPWGGNVTSQIDNSIEVVTNGKMKGLQTNAFTISDWQNTVIEFELNRSDGKYVAFLLGSSGNLIEIPVPEGAVGQWQKIRHRMGPQTDQTGSYRLVVLLVSSTNATWYTRNTSIRSRSISWSARGKSDPWGMSGNQWMPFEDTAGKRNSGVMFKEPGRLQVKARSLINAAEIEEFRVIPKYAELGRLIFEDEKIAAPDHRVNILSDTNGLIVDFAVSIQYDSNDARRPMTYAWAFDDGWKIGSSVRKVFRSSGTQSVVLRITYSDGATQSAIWSGSVAA